MRKSDGFTMVEMITVLVVFVSLMALSAAAYLTFRRDMAVRGASGQVLGMIQAAHNSALASRHKAYVVEANFYKNDQLEESRISSFTFRTVGLWHFDDESNMTSNGITKGYGGDVNVSGCLIVNGRIGGGINTQGATLTCPFDPNFVTPEGIAGSIWANLERSNETSSSVDDCVLIELPGAYRFFIQQSRLGLDIGGNQVLSSTKDGAEYYILPERWMHLSFTYDVYTRQMAIYVDKNLRGYRDLTDAPLLPDTTSPLSFGSGVKGKIDEVRLLGILEADTYVLPAGLSFSVPRGAVGMLPYVRMFESTDGKTYVKVTTFDEKGWLDSMHSGTATISFYNYADPSRAEQSRNFYINRQGMVESENPGAAAPSAAPTGN